MRDEEKRRRPTLVQRTQKAPVKTKASTTAQEYQSKNWLGHVAVSTYVRLLLNSTDQAPALQGSVRPRGRIWSALRPLPEVQSHALALAAEHGAGVKQDGAA